MGGYEGDECNTEKASNDATKKADLFEKRVERLAESLEEEEEEEKSSSTVIVDETSTMEIEDGADVEVEGGVTTIRGELDVKEGATLSVKSSAVIDLRSAEEESIDMKADKVMATIQYKYTTDPKKKCDIEKYASVHSEFCCTKNYGKGCEEEEKTIAVSGDLDIKDTATVKVDSLETKGNGRFKVSGRAKMIVSKDPRSKKKDKQEGKSLFEKKTRRTKRIAENVEKMFKDSTNEPTKEKLNQKLRDLGAMKSEKAEEPDVDEKEAKRQISKAFHIKRRAISLVCSDKKVRKLKEKDVNNVDKKRCRDMDPTVKELKDAIEGRGLDIPTTLVTADDSTTKTLKWDLWKMASKTRVMAKLMAKDGQYNKKNAEKEEVKTKEQRDISIKLALKKILKKKKLLNIQKQKKDKRIENAVKEEPTITTEEANKKEDESVDRECIMCIKSIPTCDPSCNKCAVKRSTCSTCSEAICLDVVEKEIDDLVTLDEILDKAIEEEEKEIEEKEETIDFEMTSDTTLEIEGGEMRLEGKGAIKGKVKIDGSSKVVCGRGAYVEMTSDDDEDDAPNSAEEEDDAVETKADDELDDTPRTTVDGTVELEAGPKLEVDSMTVGPTGGISGAGDLRIKSDPRTIAVKEDPDAAAGTKEKKWRSKRSKFKISSGDVLDDTAKTAAKMERKKRAYERKANSYLKRKGKGDVTTTDKELLAVVKELKLNTKEDGVTPGDELVPEDDAAMDRKEMMKRLSKAKSEDERANKLLKVDKKEVQKQKKKDTSLATDEDDKDLMIEEGLKALGISDKALALAKKNKATTGNKDLKKAASKYWRYARTMQTRGVKRTCGTTQPEKDYIKNYAKTWVVTSFRDKATQPEKDEIDAKINAKKTRETATKFPEEDQIIEEIALWDELKEEKEDEVIEELEATEVTTTDSTKK